MKPTSYRSSRSKSVPIVVRGHTLKFHDDCISEPKLNIHGRVHDVIFCPRSYHACTYGTNPMTGSHFVREVQKLRQLIYIPEVHFARQAEIEIYEIGDNLELMVIGRIDRPIPTLPPLSSTPNNKTSKTERNGESHIKPEMVNAVESGNSGCFTSLFQKMCWPFSKCLNQNEMGEAGEIFEINHELERICIEKKIKMKELKRYREEKQEDVEKWVADHSELFIPPAYRKQKPTLDSNKHIQ